MSDRVHSAEIAEVMNRILSVTGLSAARRLHLLVSTRTGLHPITVLRYHHQEIASADVKVLECLLEIESQIESGRLYVMEDETSFLNAGGEAGEEYLKWPVLVIQQFFERIMTFLGCSDPAPIYRYVADRLRMHPASVRRHHEGSGLDDAAGVTLVLREIWESLKSGEVVVFGTGEDGSVQVVPRICVLELIREIESMEVVDDGARFVSGLEQMLGLDPGEIEQLLDADAGPFIRHEMYAVLSSLRDSVSYEPCRIYEIGDMVHHHKFGIGTVIDKRHKSRIVVQFKNGDRRLLCEGVGVEHRWSYSPV